MLKESVPSLLGPSDAIFAGPNNSIKIPILQEKNIGQVLTAYRSSLRLARLSDGDGGRQSSFRRRN
jgi:hypothetical protein